MDKQPTPTAAHLLFFRKHFSLSQEAAADLAGVSRVTWSRWEKGHTPIPGHMLHTLRGMGQLLKDIQKREEGK